MLQKRAWDVTRVAFFAVGAGDGGDSGPSCGPSKACGLLDEEGGAVEVDEVEDVDMMWGVEREKERQSEKEIGGRWKRRE